MPLFWIIRFVTLFSLIAASPAALGGIIYSEDVLLHDGMVIKIERETDLKFSGGRLFFDIGGSKGEWRPSIYKIRFKHPDNQQNISWRSEDGFEPVQLDVVDGVTYLVVFGRSTKDTEKAYGCPELPYIFLRYEPGSWGGKWIPISVEEFPKVLQDANLSIDGAGLDESRHISIQGVQFSLSYTERMRGGRFQAKFPRSYDDWHINNKNKNSYRNERQSDDCRPPPKSLTDVILPNPVDIELEAVESKDYIVKSSDEYYQSLLEKKGTITPANCATLFRPADPGNSMLGERFVNDQTGSKKLPYSGPIPFPSGRMLEARTERYCDNKFVWFVAGHEELGKTIISKYTASGDLLYNIRMIDPKVAENKLYRSMVLNSISVENGYFYFFWVQELPRPTTLSMEYPNRMTKFRFREPTQKNASK